MSRLHSNAPPHPLSDTKRIVAAAFGLPWDEIFDDFDPAPLGVGAIAQVYKARLRPGLQPPPPETRSDFRARLQSDVVGLVKSGPGAGPPPGCHVAVKVVHPGVERMVARDLRIMRFFARLLDRVPTLEWLSLPDEVVVFGDMMRQQMDLRIEAENLARFRENFRERRTVAFPTPYREYCTREMLVEEFAHGVPLSAFLTAGAGCYRHEMANMGLNAFLVPSTPPSPFPSQLRR